MNGWTDIPEDASDAFKALNAAQVAAHNTPPVSVRSDIPDATQVPKPETVAHTTETVPLFLWFPGKPVTQGSKRHVGRGILIEDADVKGWRAAHAGSAGEAAWDRVGDTRPYLFHEIVHVDLRVRVLRPKTAPRWPAFGVNGPKGDTDKYQRAVGDLLSLPDTHSPVPYPCRVLSEDRKIVSWAATKRYADTPDKVGMSIRVVPLGLAQTAIWHAHRPRREEALRTLEAAGMCEAVDLARQAYDDPWNASDTGRGGTCG